MIIQITPRENIFIRLWLWLRGEMQTISDGEMLHFKGLGNTARSRKEVGDFLVFVNKDSRAISQNSALCTYEIIAIEGTQAKLELLEYNLRR